MERMKHTGDYELDRINMLEQECADLEEENKKLKSDLAFERTMLDNVRAEYKSLQNVIKKLKEEIKEIEKNQEYRYHRCMVAKR
jgi:chromosome segregation ATPase